MSDTPGPNGGAGPGGRRTGPAELLRRLLRDPQEVLSGGLLHRRAHPTLIEFSRGASLQTVDLEELLATYVGGDLPSDWAAEYAEVEGRLGARYADPGAFRTETRLSSDQSRWLYALVRARRPTRVVETGVANGHSSFVLLEALRKNGRGSLTSFDISHEVGGLVPTELRGGWDLRILPLRGTPEAFRSAVRALGPIDLFEHDSDHSYRWVTWELNTVWPLLAPGGVVSIDDADWSWAALDFARRHGLRLRNLVTPTRVCATFPRS